MNATYCSLIANLAYPISYFDSEAELMGTLAKKTVRSSESAEISSESPKQQINSPNQGESSFSIKQFEKTDPNTALFERMIILIPYKAPDTVK